LKHKGRNDHFNNKDHEDHEEDQNAWARSAIPIGSRLLTTKHEETKSGLAFFLRDCLSTSTHRSAGKKPFVFFVLFVVDTL